MIPRKIRHLAGGGGGGDIRRICSKERTAIRRPNVLFNFVEEEIKRKYNKKNGSREYGRMINVMKNYNENQTPW